VAARHAYVSGALRAALQAARERDGVLSSAEFTWLKGVDRSLWYALNGLGRATAWPECAGAVAHWAMERAAGRPLDTPCVDAACQAMLLHVERARQDEAEPD
jgi:intracellular multiplication protein IcmP